MFGRNSPVGIKSWIGNTSITLNFFHASPSQISAAFLSHNCWRTGIRKHLFMTCSRHCETRSQRDSPMKLRRILERIKLGSDTFDVVKPSPPYPQKLSAFLRGSLPQNKYISFISRAITKHVWKSLSKFDLEISAFAPIILPRDSRQFRTSRIFFLVFSMEICWFQTALSHRLNLDRETFGEGSWDRRKSQDLIIKRLEHVLTLVADYARRLTRHHPFLLIAINVKYSRASRILRTKRRTKFSVNEIFR